MNYRHAFHAGNFADVHKHAVLALILMHLRLKSAAFRVLDTHGGAGRYDLAAPQPSRSGEWREGIGRLWALQRIGALCAPLLPYLEAVAALNPDGELRVYPGSPLVALRVMRRRDRLLACEIELAAAAALAAALRRDNRAKALTVDGWTALGAYVPPKERRGLVLVAPPFEEAADFVRLSTGLAAAYRKWPTGIFMLWYPIKDGDAPEALARRLQRLIVAKILRCEFNPGPPHAPGGLAGSGLVVVNPPFTLEADLHEVMPALGAALAPHAAFRIDWLARERVP